MAKKEENPKFNHCEAVCSHIGSVAEELQLNGFDVKVIGWLIEYDTIAGKMKYACSEKTLMGDYYRFISHLGSKLHKWGLENKIEVSKNSI